MKADDRPVDPTPVHTDDLPPLPTRDRNIPAAAWIEAPSELLSLGDDIDQSAINYKRSIGPWLLWRAGPAKGESARYMAIRRDDLAERYVFTLDATGEGEGRGPSGVTHARFRTWKEDLRDHDGLLA